MAAVPAHLNDMVDQVRDAVEHDRSVSVHGLSSRLLLDTESSRRVADVTVRAPVGVLDFQPDEMIVRCGAGTPIDDLRSVLAEHGQTIEISGAGTVGGGLARGWSSVHRLGRGPIRDVLLETLFVDHGGRLVRAGGPTVKNVTGFDLVRVLVGALGTLGFFGEVTLRTRPRPLDARWFAIDHVDHDRLRHVQSSLFRPTSLLWNGSRLWVHLEGHPRDLDEAMSPYGAVPVDAPTLPVHRWSMSPAESLRHGLRSDDVVEVGVGLVHRSIAAPPREISAIEIHRRLDAAFNPRHLLNPHIVRFGDRRPMAQGANANHSAETV